MTAEFSRMLAVDTVGREPRRMTVEASTAECEALASRMGLAGIERLRCDFTLSRISDSDSAIVAEGRLDARVVQACIVTLDEFAADLAEEFSVRFVPEGSESEEIDLDAPDEVPYSGNRIDLGEAAAEQLALAVDPFPRKPGAELEDLAGETANPFAGLEKLRRH